MNTSGILYTGIPSAQELESCPGIPSPGRFDKGPVAVVECVQEIPCDPCAYFCSSKAITLGQSITQLPVLDGEKCSGCGECLAHCPGLAIFWVHKNFTGTTSLVEFPYEFLPLPEEGQRVPCGGRDGQFIAYGTVIKVRKTKNTDGTALVRVEVPKEFFMDIRTLCRKGKNHGV